MSLHFESLTDFVQRERETEAEAETERLDRQREGGRERE